MVTAESIRQSISEAIAEELANRVRTLGIDLINSGTNDCKVIYQPGGIEKYFWRDTCILTVQLKHGPGSLQLVFEEIDHA